VNDDRLAESVIMFRHGVALQSPNDLGRMVPEQLARKMATLLEDRARQLSRTYNSLATEPDMSGHLVGLWADQEVSEGEWVIRTKAVTFNPTPRSPDSIQILASFSRWITVEPGRFKALWMQASARTNCPATLQTCMT